MFPWPEGWSPLLDTCGSLSPFSPTGFEVSLSTPTLVIPESEATAFSPGAEPEVCPGALEAPRPCSRVLHVSARIDSCVRIEHGDG